jgi:hypothetical protein
MRGITPAEQGIAAAQEEAWIQETAREMARRAVDEEPDRFIPIIPCEDRPIHTEVNPFCSDWECPCHGDVHAINAVTDDLMAGLITWHEANLILRGETI